MRKGIILAGGLVDWPIISGTSPILSQKDEFGSTLENAEVFA